MSDLEEHFGRYKYMQKSHTFIYAFLHHIAVGNIIFLIPPTVKIAIYTGNKIMLAIYFSLVAFFAIHFYVFSLCFFFNMIKHNKISHQELI